MACVVNFESPPEYCTKSLTNTQCPVWNAAMTSLASSATKQGVMYADLATCQTVPASSVVQSGVTLSQVKLNNGSWPGEDVAVSTDLCSQSRYPVIDKSTGQVAKVGNETVDTRKDLWRLMSQACETNLPPTYSPSSNVSTMHGWNSSKRKASHMDYSQDWSHDQNDDDDYPAAKKRQLGVGDTPTSNPKLDFAGAFDSIEQNGKQQVSFTYSCTSPSDTCYTKCKLPGFDYVDTTTTPWSFTNGSNKTCGKAPDPTNTTHCDPNSSPGTATVATACTSGGCCVPTFPGSNTCALCANNIESNLSTANLGIWNDTSYSDSDTPPGSVLISLPYTGDKGIAITLLDSYTGDTSSFGDPVDCYPGGTFNGFCNGLQGCTGTNASDCVQGLSNYQAGAGPAYNCPNIYNLSRQANSCQSIDYSQKNAEDTLSGGLNSYSTVTHMFVPEGAYVTGWNLGPTIGFDGGEGLCAPNQQLPKFGIQLMCGRESKTTDPNKPPRSTGCWGPGYQVSGYSNNFSIDTTGAYNKEAPVDPTTPGFPTISYNGSVVMRDNVCGCYFKNLTKVSGVQNHNVLSRGYQGFTFGFMPGYYDSTLQTGQGACV